MKTHDVHDYDDDVYDNTYIDSLKDNLPREEVGIITADGKEHFWNSKSLQRLGKVDMAVITFTSKKNYQVAKIGEIKSQV